MNHTHIITKQKTGILQSRIKNIKAFGIIKKYTEITLRAILIVAFLVTILTVVTSQTNALFNIRSYTVLSGSMEPTIPTGSIIYTHKNLGYNVNDVITFEAAKDQIVTHRVIDIENNGEVQYITKGDANTTIDQSRVTADKILGKTYFFFPYIGKISAMLKTPKGLITVVFFPALLIVLFELWNIKKEIEKGVERRLLHRMKNEGGAHTHSPLWPNTTS